MLIRRIVNINIKKPFTNVRVFKENRSIIPKEFPNNGINEKNSITLLRPKNNNIIIINEHDNKKILSNDSKTRLQWKIKAAKSKTEYGMEIE